jgi:hypothetical protein
MGRPRNRYAGERRLRMGVPDNDVCIVSRLDETNPMIKAHNL